MLLGKHKIKQVTGSMLEKSLLRPNFPVWVNCRSEHFSKSLALEMGMSDGVYFGENVQ